MIIDLTILALAIFRITRLITTDMIFTPYREKIWKKFPPNNNGIGYAITCDWCTSIWVSSLVFTLYKIATEPVIFVSSIFALAAVSGFLSRVN